MRAEATREEQARIFAELAGWGAAKMAPLAGDASSRRYWRLSEVDISDRTAILMDAPPDRGEDIRPFTRIARHLSERGYSAPVILAEDAHSGFLLLEDLGDALYATVLTADPSCESDLYEAAVDLLAELHRDPAPEDLPVYGPVAMAEKAVLAALWYLPGLTGGDADEAFADALRDACLEMLLEHAPATSVLALRDYHAENLIWLPNRKGAARVGLLDFQDGMAGHPAYDLVSLLEDARRDVPPALKESMIARYLSLTGEDPETFRAAFAVLGAQRNLRILGVFARLCLHFGKRGYVQLIPRVWAHLRSDLSHPATKGIADILRALPEPTEIRLEALAARAGTCPKP